MKRFALASAAILALSTGFATAQDLKFPIGEGGFNWDSYNDFKAGHDLSGQTLSIFGPWRGDDQALVESVLAYFVAATGVKLSYASSENYEQQIVIDTQAGSPPDIAVLPQPGLIADLAAKGALTPLGPEVGTWLQENYAAGDSWVKLATYKGKDGQEGGLRLPLQDRREVAGLVCARELRGRGL